MANPLINSGDAVLVVYVLALSDRIMVRTIRHLFGNMTVSVLFPAIPIIIKRLVVSTICMSPLTTYHQKESFQTL